MSAHVSGIVMFAGADDRLDVAIQLAEENRAPVLIVSQGHEGYSGPCPKLATHVQVMCFDPVPSDTRGEAEFAASFAKRNHWTSVVLVTGRLQDTRARLLMSRCFSGPIYVVTASLRWYEWPSQLAYESGALFKALALHTAC
jgi:hypothetical protein